MHQAARATPDPNEQWPKTAWFPIREPTQMVQIGHDLSPICVGKLEMPLEQPTDAPQMLSGRSAWLAVWGHQQDQPRIGSLALASAPP
jgi:hypothetical protein